ncbi:GNAT family N-acetyltransferase [Marinilabilia salmonicolor]|uniref:GNAT family N-acetyltransferase n=1 Tax=Marinilabilia salmonicolor TaxID=989 RepID=UPI001930BB6C|nr:GNAT family N-acetyltransferase [Marinilabilia salmonicolor]
MEIKRYQQDIDEPELMQMIKDEEGWDYADDKMAERYKFALGNSITFVAYQNDVLCGYSRSLDDCGFYIYVCDLLVKPAYRGNEIGRKLMGCLMDEYPGQTVYVMSDVDAYYEKVGFQKIGSVFEVKK